jgi:cytochrome P450 family 3 subfamily A
MEAVMILTLIVSFFSTIYVYYKIKYSFWKKRGVHGPQPNLIIGNMTLETPLFAVYQKRKDKYGDLYGVFEGATPKLVVTDPVLVKRIMIQDFNHFANRRQDGFDHPLEQKMFFIQDEDEWRKGRNVCSPAFSSGKIRAMTPFIEEAVELLMLNMDIKLKESKGNEIELKEVFRSYSLYNIGKTMFGVEMDTYNWDTVDPTIKTAMTYLTPSTVKSIVSMVLPKWFKTLVKFTVFNKNGLHALSALISSIVTERSKTINERRNYADFISIVLKNRSSSQDLFVTDDDVVANCLLFLVAGVETSLLVLSIGCFLLAKHPDDQERLYQEITRVIGDNSVTLESINQMTFLDAVVNETLRLYPPSTFTERRVSKEYNLETPSGQVINLPIDTLVYISIYTIHHSVDNYPKPEEFMPERFLPENKKQIDPMAFLPFGHGPRACIGNRISLINIKMALVNIVLKYRLERGEKTPEELDMSATNDEIIVTPDIFIKFIGRQ